MQHKNPARHILVVLMLIFALSPSGGQADQVAPRSITIGSSAAGTSTTHTIAFTVPTGGNVGSISFQYCTTAYAACVTPTGLVTTAATLTAQSGATGFSLVNSTNGTPYLTRSSTNLPATTAVSYTLSAVTNPTTTNTEFWVRIKTYVSTDTTGSSTDDGVVAFDTANQIIVSGTMPESLVFCVGTAGSDCSNITGTSVDLGVFSPTSTASGTSIMSASTNASSGYAITINGTTLASGSNTIPAMTGAGSSIGSSQFGTNLRANSTPAVGGNVSGLGNGAAASGYNTTNQYKFATGNTVASAAGPTKDNLYTNSYIVNVGGDQAAGVYTATMTYICTATF